MKKRGFYIRCIAIILAVSATAVSIGAASLKKGSYGEAVKQLQEVLSDYGYYNSDIDGIFGSRTEAAVKRFQSDTGLTVDGKAGANTLAVLGISSGGTNDGDVYLLARLISAEARGEPYAGQVAVGAVVLNRVDHPSFPNSISGVIYQRGAFSCISDGQFDEPISESAYRAAREALAGYDPSGGAIYYFNPTTATSGWIWSRPLIVTIGKHRFCS